MAHEPTNATFPASAVRTPADMLQGDASAITSTPDRNVTACIDFEHRVRAGSNDVITSVRVTRDRIGITLAVTLRCELCGGEETVAANRIERRHNGLWLEIHTDTRGLLRRWARD